MVTQLLPLHSSATESLNPAMTETLQLDPTRTALVLIEYQNEFTSPGGDLHDAVKPRYGQHRDA